MTSVKRATRVGGNRIVPKAKTRSVLNDITKSRWTDSSVTGIEAFTQNYIKQADENTTNAYGEIEFGGNRPTAKYIKVSESTKVEVLYTLITKHWKLKTPNLIISVTGGARNFNLRPRLKEVFRRSLIKASETTGAWITTGGTRTGVMKHVGKAVQQYAAVKDDEKRVVTIGVAPWGIVHRRDLLLNHKGRGQSTAKVYDVEEGQEGRGALLDHNHSHFILVDNGLEYNKDGDDTSKIYGSEIELRAALEGHIGCQKTSDRVKVMTVCVIVQGGPGSLKTVAESIRNKTPAVIVEGSGGWADVLAKACKINTKTLTEDSLRDILIESSMEFEENQLEGWLEMVLVCLSDKNLLTVFSLDPTDMSRDLDIAILESLLKANSEDEKPSYEQLRLAVAWNRSDIAQSNILTDDTTIKKKQIAELFYEILKANKHEFCEVFLNYGVDLKKYFTVKDLKSLYASAPKDLVFYDKLYKIGFALEGVGKLLLEYLGKSYINVYKKRGQSPKYSAICENEDSDQSGVPGPQNWADDCKIDDPYREIFQWAILFNYREIAKHIWENMFGATQAAIMASRMLKVLASKMGQDQEKKLLMKSDAAEYEMRATGIFAKCFMESPSKSFDLLITRLPKWGGYTCLHMAMEADDKHFVSSPGVQNFFDQIWTSKLSRNHSWHLIVAGLTLLPILITVKFEKKEEGDKDGGARTVENGDATKNDQELQVIEKKPDDEERNTGGVPTINNPEVDIEGQKEYSYIEKIAYFYDAPIVTFWLNVVSFLVYLILFAYVVLSSFQIQVTTVSVPVWEYILLVWTSTFFLEEIRELINQDARFRREKIRKHVTQLWNIMDLSSLFLFYIGFGLRFYTQYLEVTLVLYSLAFMIQCIRLVHIFAVHPVLGPKIIMVGKMSKDLLFFLFILIVFLLAYGVASQALLYPNETDFVDILVGIIYRPYWQIYGELFLEEINYNPNLGDFTCSDTDASLPRCPRSTPIVPIISAVYLLFANVLLLNLLIAMFSYTFEKVESQNKEIWMFQRYNLIIDYYFRPPFVPPLIGLYHIYLTFSYIARKIRNRDKPDAPFHNTLKKTLNHDEWKALRQWEHWHAHAYVSDKRQEDENTIDRQLIKLGQRMDSIFNTMEERFQEHSKFIVKKLSHPERMSRVNLPKASAKQIVEPEVKRVAAPREAKTPPTQQKTKNEERVASPVHVKARCTVYPDSKVKKVAVPDDKVLWKVEWKDYKPPSFTHSAVAKNPSWADEDLEHYDVQSRPRLPFNKYDQKAKVLRASHTGNYLVEDGIPKNPKGRTGIQGRGLLGRYGPNHAADPVVTRWKKENGEQCRINDKPVLEFVAILRDDTREWAIPGGMVEPGEHVSQTLKREFGEEALSLEGLNEEERRDIEHLFKSGGLELFRGYCDDHRNTDNAWIETVACNFHDEVGDAFDHIQFVPQKGEARAVTWITVDRDLKLFASHYEYLKKAAEMHNAHF